MERWPRHGGGSANECEPAAWRHGRPPPPTCCDLLQLNRRSCAHAAADTGDVAEGCWSRTAFFMDKGPSPSPPLPLLFTSPPC
ncbi:hypothetical protein FKM82_031108 [Ascaphus truei]